MIRYVDLTGQLTLEDDEFYFAWYDTITDQFLSFAGQQTFSSWADFLEAFKDHIQDDEPIHGHKDLLRFYRLYPRKIEIMDIYYFAEVVSGGRLSPWQMEYCKSLSPRFSKDKPRSTTLCLIKARGAGKTWINRITTSYYASKAIGRFARWAGERMRNEEGKTG